jgi:hypothetical protein
VVLGVSGVSVELFNPSSLLRDGERGAVFLSERGRLRCLFVLVQPDCIAPGVHNYQIDRTTIASSRQTAIPGFERNTRISFRITRLAPTCEGRSVVGKRDRRHSLS